MKLSKRLAAIALAVFLAITLLSIPVFADETGAATGNTDPNATTAPKMELPDIINLSILGGVVVVAIVLCIVFRKGLVKKFRVYKSESKKVVWLSWADTKKNTWVVLVVMILLAAAICVIDMALSKGLMKVLELLPKA